MKIGIIAALPQEFSILTNRSVEFQQPVQLSANVNAIMSGMGAENAYNAAELLYSFNGYLNGILSWGVAAGLTPALSPGEVVIPKWFVNADHQKINLENLLYGLLIDKLKKCEIHTDLAHAETSEFLNDKLQKKNLHLLTKAHSADMESGALQRFAQLNNLHFAVVRAISDGINCAIPPFVSHNTDDQGHVNIMNLILEMVLNPSQWRHMYHIAKGFRTAKKSLRTISEQILTD